MKRIAQEHEDRVSAIAIIAVEQNSIELDMETDEISSNGDIDADKRTYASVFKAWADGKLDGSAEEIFEATKEVLEA